MTKLIALIVEDDQVFALPAWHRTMSLLERRGLIVTHVAVVPSAVSQYRGVLQTLWYLSVFGLGNAVRLAFFSLLEKRRRQTEPATWEQMAHTHALVVRRFDSAGAEMQEFLRSSRCDVLHILAPVALSPAILNIPRSGAIAHHSSMLPSCRGTFPYFWGRLQGEPLGVSLQQLSSENQQGGPLLAQREAPPLVTRSMLAFQVWAARRYPEMALDATQRLLAGRSLPERAGVVASYGGIPTRRDRHEFESRGGRLSTWADLRLTLSIRTKPSELLAKAEPEAPPAGATAYQFPEVLPLLVTRSEGRGKVIPMRPRRPQVAEG